MKKFANKVWEESWNYDSSFNQMLCTIGSNILPAATVTFFSAKPAHIDVAGDPPLCVRCRAMILGPRSIDVKYTHSYLRMRMRAAAELGCCLCLLFYSTLPKHDSIQSGLGRQFFSLKYAFHAENEGEKEDGRSCIKLTTTFSSSPRDIMRMIFVLLPEAAIELRKNSELAPFTEPESSAKLGLEWLSKCETGHKKCARSPKLNKSSWRPTRLIHITKMSPNQLPEPRLCLSAGHQLAHYIAVSHCWGGINFLKLLSTNLENMFDAIPWDELTQTFRDAIEISRRLGIEYLWIDSLCIIQDSREDWKRESAMMGQVYTNCWCNISATGFRNGKNGLFVQRDVSMVEPRKFLVGIQNDKGENITKNQHYVCENIWWSDISQAPLNERAWVFQERVLSPRILHFGSRQLLWECNELTACEVFPEGMPGLSSYLSKADLSFPIKNEGASLHEESKDEILLYWNDMVSVYNSGNLTKHEDKFIAIAGITQNIQKLLEVPFFAGLWQHKFPQQLLWSTSKMVSNNSWEKKLNATLERSTYDQRAAKYQAPSWSWASINGPVHVDKKFMSYEPLISIKDVILDHADDMPFGQLLGGYLRVQGGLVRATISKVLWWLDKSYMPCNKPVVLTLRTPLSEETVVAIIYPDVVNASNSGLSYYLAWSSLVASLGSDEFWLLPVAKGKRDGEVTTAGLVLAPVAKKGQYRRIGMFTTRRVLQQFVPLLDVGEYETRHTERTVVLTII